MNGNERNRFDKLYELLGDEVNSIFDIKKEEEIFTEDNENKKLPFLKEIYIEPMKINVKKESKNKVNDVDKYIDKIRVKEIKDKSKNKDNVIYLDDVMDDDGNGIIGVISDRNVLYIFIILIIIMLGILIVRGINYKKIYNNYHEYEEANNGNDTKVYADKFIDSEMINKGSAMELVECISRPIDTDNLPDSVNMVIKEINDYYKSSGDYFAFTYKDIFTGFTVSYNENGNIFAASTTKAPANIYLYDMASQGKIDLDEEIKYTSYYYNGGTGVLKNKKVNTDYTIRELSGYAIIYSDNAAHNMLVDKYGRNNIRDYWQEMGTNVIFTGSDNFGMINAHDATIYMDKLYEIYLKDKVYGKELMDNFVNTSTKFITGKNDYVVANKTGWSGNSQHDVAIVFADNPYIVVALSKLGMNNNYMSYFNKVNDLAYQLHEEYWKYKTEECSDIKIYNK